LEGAQERVHAGRCQVQAVGVARQEAGLRERPLLTNSGRVCAGTAALLAELLVCCGRLLLLLLEPRALLLLVVVLLLLLLLVLQKLQLQRLQGLRAGWRAPCAGEPPTALHVC
jgi:hypothetical protein